MNDHAAISITGLEKWYRKHHVLRGVTIELKAGEIVALMGPNGSGKSTLMKCIVGLVQPSAGSITVCGVDIHKDSTYRAWIGYMPQIVRYPESLTVKELFATVAQLRDAHSDFLDRSLYDQLCIHDLEHKSLGSLSGGQRQRVNAALAFYFSPNILLLDEPTAGLDPVSNEIVKERMIADKQRGTTILMTTHSPQDVLDVADRVVYLYEGRVAINKGIEDLLAQSGSTSLMKAIAFHLTLRAAQ